MQLQSGPHESFQPQAGFSGLLKSRKYLYLSKTVIDNYAHNFEYIAVFLHRGATGCLL